MNEIANPQSSTPPMLTPSILTPPRLAQPWWVQSLALLVVFVAGGFAGAFVAVKFVHTRMEHLRTDPDALPDMVASKLERILSLSDQQSEKVREIINRRHPRMVEFRNQSARGMHSEFDAMQLEIAEVLDPDQAEQWSIVAERIRQRFLPR